MLKSKLIKPAAAFIIAVIIAGCSETIPVNTETGSGQKETSLTLDNVSDHVEYIRIKPENSYVFNSENTPFNQFYAIDVIDPFQFSDFVNGESVCDRLFIYGHKSETESELLSCKSFGKNLNSIIIQNLSGKQVELKVSLRGKLKSKLTKN